MLVDDHLAVCSGMTSDLVSDSLEDAFGRLDCAWPAGART